MIKKWTLLWLLLLFPLTTLAYSSSIYVGGETIGIAVQAKGVYVVGFYPVEGEYIGKENGFLEGDIILKINQDEISSIDDLYSVLEKDESFSVEVLRNNQYITLTPKFSFQDSSLKTGLYVKDNIQGIGTLSYIDPETHVFGSLGHEIIESSSQSRFLINQGAIFKAEVDSVKKSENGVIGSKKASIDSNKDIGIIEANEAEGIFGFYQDDIQDKELMAIANPSEIKRGKAVIRTVLEDNKIKEYDIQVLTIEDSLDTKNIFFEITDSKLLKETGGIIQGMSGSPIIQNNKVIGVVNYVVVDNPYKGYGVFITKMLEKGDKILD